MRCALFALAIMITACRGDETLRAYGAADRVWVLVEIDGTPFQAHATLTFPKEGQIAGQAPCNRFSGEMSVPYPWFETGPIASTKMACPDLAAETEFFSALADMQLAEVLGDVLILKTPEGREMVFNASDV